MSAPSKARRIGVPLAALAALLVVWELVVDVGLVPNFLLPTPVQVVAALVEDAQLIAGHCVVTLAEAAAGLAAGVALGFVFAVLMDRFETFYLAFEPLMTVSQTIPTVAIAPLLVLWLGYGALP
uniref:ABC transporter permease n=1 Tax=Thermophilibacter sp. TaxID=2847309 RepID=UPI003A91FFF2